MENNNRKPLFDLLRLTADNLIALYKDGSTYSASSKLLPPTYRTDGDETTLRNSEQEARFILTAMLEKMAPLDWRYSIETPTKERYSFSDGGTRSALIDVSIYNQTLDNILYNVELKFGNVAEKNIQKDLEKLVKEPAPGVFFHILKNYNTGTFPSLFGKYTSGIETASLSGAEKSVTLIILVIDKEEIRYFDFNVKDPTNIPSFDRWEKL